MRVIEIIVQKRDDVGDDDVGEVKEDKEGEDSLHLLPVWQHSSTLTNGETLYVYESH